VKSRMNFIDMRWVVALACAWAATSASADSSIYTCKDHSGRTQTSDHPIPDCAGVMRELGQSGIVKREIAPPLTAEQLHQKELDDKAKRTAEEASREKRRRDTALLAAYQSEAQIEAARRRSLADAADSIKTSQTRLTELEKEKQALMQEGETFKGKPPTPLFKRRVEDNQVLIDDEEASMKMRKSDVDRVNQRYDDELKRYRELSKGGATK
jgi:Domain of unknown function (DUF4124)